VKNDPIYKDKWGAIFGKLKKISNHMSIIGYNENYWAMNPQDKIAHHLPKQFNKVPLGHDCEDYRKDAGI
jgi:hypothetical protein